MLGGSLLLTLLWLWAQSRFTGSLYVTALSPMAYMFPSLGALHYTSLKGRSAAAQTIFIAGISAVMTLFFLAVAWLSTII